jgi:RNA polymerase sigma-70 factor (ECF subfamily)
MMTPIQQANSSVFAAYLPAVLPLTESGYRETYEQNRHRVYAIAFWMTDNELAAEQLMVSAFTRVFARNAEPSPQQIDKALVEELRELVPLGTFTLDCAPCNEVRSVRYNILRVDLERALVQVPSTEKMIFILHDVESYDHARIADTLGLSEEQTRFGLHQARLYLRQLLGK